MHRYGCRVPTKANSKYCPIHGRIIVDFAEQGARARAFRRAFHKKTGHILCHYTNQPLNLTDQNDPSAVRVTGVQRTAGSVQRTDYCVRRSAYDAVRRTPSAQLPLGAPFDGSAGTFHYWTKK